MCVLLFRLPTFYSVHLYYFKQINKSLAIFYFTYIIFSVNHKAPPIPSRERNTIMGNLTIPGKRDSGFRHTAIIGSSSSQSAGYPYDITDLDAPPLPEKERFMTMTLGRPAKHKVCF